MPNDLMQREMVYQLIDGQEMRLTMGMVKKYLVQGRSEYVTEKELMYFMHECKARKLNPFLRECWLIKYSQSDNAQIVESIHHKRMRARKHKDCQGWTKGIVFQDKDGQLHQSPHPFLPDGAILKGAYFEATPVGWAVPYRHEVSLAAVVKKKRDGSFTAFWTPEKQPQQLMKVAESQGLTALWGGEIGNTIIPEEMAEIETTENAKDIGTDIYNEVPMSEPLAHPTNLETKSGVCLAHHNDEGTPTKAPKNTDQQVDSSNWWEDMNHIKFRKQMPFYLLLLLGRGVELSAHELPLADGRTLKLNTSYHDLMNRLADDNPGSIKTLDDVSAASKVEITNLMCRKMGVTRENAETFIDGDIHGWMEAAQAIEDSFMKDEQPEQPEQSEQQEMSELPKPRTDLSGEPYLVMMNLWDNYDHADVAKGFKEMEITEWPGLAQSMFLLKDIVDRKVEGVKSDE